MAVLLLWLALDSHRSRVDSFLKKEFRFSKETGTLVYIPPVDDDDDDDVTGILLLLLDVADDIFVTDEMGEAHDDLVDTVGNDDDMAYVGDVDESSGGGGGGRGLAG